jgi:hypothetical protein
MGSPVNRDREDVAAAEFNRPRHGNLLVYLERMYIIVCFGKRNFALLAI